MRLVAAVLGLVLAVAAANAALAADDPFLAKLVGDWIGRGAMKHSPEGGPERLYCKISNALTADGMTLIQKGRCSLASNSGTIDGSITAVSDGTYTGGLASLASRSPAVLKGKLVKGALVMDAQYVDKLSGEPVQSVNTIALVDGGYSLTATRVNPADGTSYTSSQIIFTGK